MGYRDLTTIMHPFMNGELNAYVEETAGKPWLPRKDADSRTLFVLQCKAAKAVLLDNKYTQEQKAHVAQYLFPVTDLRLVIYPANTAPEALEEQENTLVSNGWEALRLWTRPEPPRTGFAAIKMGLRNVGVKLARLVGLMRARKDDDLNFGRSKDRPSIFVYIQRGGASPLTGIELAPFQKYAKGFDKTTMMTRETRLRHDAAIKQTEECEKSEELEAPMYCSVTDCIHKNVTRVVTNAWLDRLKRLVTHGSAAKNSDEVGIYHRFITTCVLQDFGHEWSRVFYVSIVTRTCCV